MKILLVEDETLLVENLKLRFADMGALVDTAVNGEQALWALEQCHYEVVVLDLGLPKVSGLEVLKSVRAQGVNQTSPILILSARNSWKERVEGLNAGADDYLGKPFEFDELWARMEALYRRNMAKNSHQDLLEIDGLQLNLNLKNLTINESVIELTKTEFRLLHYFMQHPDHVLSKDQLLDRISDEQSDRGSNVIEVYIRKLRQKVGRERIETLRGLGYRFVKSLKNAEVC